jgi:hypothetical protein
MGFSISWIGFRGISKAEVLSRTSLRDTGVLDDALESPFSIAEFPDGWIILHSNDFNYASPEKVARLSSGCRVIACLIEEHVMFSAAACFEDANNVWSIVHDSERGIYALETTGYLPAEFAAARDQLSKEQDDNGGDKSDVDFIFDVPLDTAAAICGYKHDIWTGDSGDPSFYGCRP